MTSHYGLIVTDASPLITLAAADALNLLTIPNIPIAIPDMVYYEVTRDIAKLGATPVIEWARANRSLVRIEPTEVYAEYMALLQINPKTPSRGRGERAASEILQIAVADDSELLTFLLYEDSDIKRRRFADLLPERVLPITTGGFLQELEAAGKIQSATQILDQAVAKGRDVSKQYIAATPEEIAAALHQHLAPNKKENSEQGR
jgi:predicted nucleic acid-binding protein